MRAKRFMKPEEKSKKEKRKEVQAQKAKVRRKETKRIRRIEQAKTKTALLATSVLIFSMYLETKKFLTMDNEARMLLEKVAESSMKCTNSIEFGKKSTETTGNMTSAADKEIKKKIEDGKPKTVGHYAMAWLMLGYLSDEAKNYVSDSRRELWENLSHWTNLWVDEIMAQSPEDETDYEEEAGELADNVWTVIFGMSNRYVKLK